MDLPTDRQGNRELCVASFDRFEWNYTSKSSYQVFSDVETQTYAFFIDAFVLLHDFTEKLEHTGLVFLADTNASVIDFKLNSVNYSDIFTSFLNFELRRLGTDLYVPFECKLSWVPKNVDQDLL